MRYLVLSLILFLGGQLPATTLYVWAPSGLSLRAAGKAGAEKLAVIPHGAAVQTTNQVGDELTVTALPEWHEGEIHSEAYRLRGSYVKVRYDDTEGYVFSAYLLPYPPPNSA